MKICFTVDSMNSGGAERVVSVLANEFIKASNEVTILMVSYNKKESFYDLDKRINLISLVEGFKKKVNPLRRVKMLKNTILGLKPDVVIAFLPHVCIYTHFALIWTSIPYVCSERNDPSRMKLLYKIFSKLSFRKASYCVFQTQEAERWYGRKVEKKSIIIPNPIFLSLGINSIDFPEAREKTIISVGRLVDQKNYPMLLQAFSEFYSKHQDYVLKIYGTGPLLDNLKELSRKLNITKNVYFLGNSSCWQVTEKNAGMFILTSKYEGMPNALAEALCVGIPCIASNCKSGGPRYLIKDGENGFLFETSDFKELVSKMSLLADNQEISKRFFERNSQLSQSLKPINIANKWINMLNTIVRKEYER